ncbi:MAG: tetratricopeptide repeat protein [Candidatus Tenebribacter burtonii]|jgi:tetratricopeptide (TPR) repeat protein|nr:tetratricopeptide repeat protein [Candidatus Tenebribacter burtonii]
MISFIEDLKEKHLRKKGQILLSKNDFEKAYLLFEKAIFLNNSVENRFNLALSLLSLSEYSKAKKYLENIYDEFPENELNLLALAECHIMQKMWDEAIMFYKLIVKLFPGKKNYKHYLDIAKDVVAREKYVKAKELFKKATIELKQKNDENALNILLEANEYFPEDATIINNIATLYIMLKDFRKAYNYSMKAVSIKPDDIRFQNNLKIAKRKLKK